LPLNAVFGGHDTVKNVGRSILTRLLFVVVSLCSASFATALEVRVFLGACHPGLGCYWDLRIGADRQLAIEVFPQAHQSKRFTLSRKAFSGLQALLQREDFFSLPEHLGDLVVDGPQASLKVRDGKKTKEVLLDKLPEEWRPIWRSDSGATGRAFRVCEGIRALAQLPEILQCPGISSEKAKQ
jgi:hypothetical protein